MRKMEDYESIIGKTGEEIVKCCPISSQKGADTDG